MQGCGRAWAHCTSERPRCSHQLHEDAGTTTESPHIVLVQYCFAWISLALRHCFHCNSKAAKTSKINDGEAALAKLDSQHRFWARQSQSHVEGPCCMKAWSTVSSSSSLHSNGEGPWTMISTGKRLSQHSKQATSDSANVVTASGFTPLLPLRAEDALAQRAASARHYGDEDGPSSNASRSNVPSPFPTSPSLHAAPSTPLQSSQWRGGQHHLGASGTPGWLLKGRQGMVDVQLQLPQLWEEWPRAMVIFQKKSATICRDTWKTLAKIRDDP